MAGGKGKSIGGKATGAKDSTSKSQKSHSAKAGLQVSRPCFDSVYAWLQAHCKDGDAKKTTPLMSNLSHLAQPRQAIRLLWSLHLVLLSALVAHHVAHCVGNIIINILTRPSSVPLRSSQAFPQEQHSKQDARWC